MPFGWGRIRPEFVTAPAEPSPRAEGRIRDLDEAAFIAWQAGDIKRMDRLIDLRNAIRPGRDPAPVRAIPGRPS